MNGVPFPRGVDGLTGDWLTSVLHSAERLSAPVGVESFKPEFAEQWGAYCPAILDDIAQPRTLCHGDWRADNLFMDGNKMAALDFQILGIGSGLYDVAYFTSQSMEPSVRAGRDRELIAHYVEALKTHGVSIDLEVAWRQYRQALMFCFLYPVNLMSGYEAMDPRGQQLMRTLLARSAAAVEDTHAIEALQDLPVAS